MKTSALSTRSCRFTATVRGHTTPKGGSAGVVFLGDSIGPYFAGLRVVDAG